MTAPITSICAICQCHITFDPPNTSPPTGTPHTGRWYDDDDNSYTGDDGHNHHPITRNWTP